MYSITTNEVQGFRRLYTKRGIVWTNIVTSVNFPGTKSGEKVPDWKAKIAAGSPATSAYSRTGSSISYAEEGHCAWVGTYIIPPPPGTKPETETCDGFATMPSPPLTLSVSVAKAEAIALAQIYNKISQEIQHLNTPAVLAEFGDVLHQFGHPFASIIDLTNRHLNRLALERRRLKGSTAFKRIKWSEIVASSYLEYAFGLAPLISDTKKVAEAFARFKEEGSEEILGPRSKIVARGSDLATTRTVEVHVSPDINSQWIKMVRNTVNITEARVQYTVGLGTTLRADFGSNARLLQLLGFNAENWIPAAWEAIPWSWLVDYFTNVQQILQASVTSTASVKWISRSQNIHSEKTVACDPDTKYMEERAFNSGLNSHVVGHLGRWKTISTNFQRTVPGSLGVPPVSFELPTQVGQLANMAAVLISRKPSSSALWLF